MTPSDPSVPDSGRGELMERMRAYLAATPSGDGRTFHPGHPEVLISEALALLATVTRERDEAHKQIVGLENRWSLHRGDVMSLSGDLDRERERANEAEAESLQLADALAAERQTVIEECAQVLEHRKGLYSVDRANGQLAVSECAGSLRALAAFPALSEPKAS